MLAEIERETLDTSSYTGRARLGARVLRAMDEVPRHEFVPAHLQAYAYDNAPLPIGHGQTISQPYIVAIMTDLLNLDAGDVVLEIGTGCGYQTAVLARLARQVYSIEIVEPLATQARERLAQLGYDNVEVRVGDGHRGWPEHAPFDAIILTASPPRIPPAVLQQLADGGRLVAPLSRDHGGQELVLMQKDARGHVTTRDVLPVAFVPLTGTDTSD
jgi:protein-L-isoaspartate(D-aspartate) O-methyltransferase